MGELKAYNGNLVDTATGEIVEYNVSGMSNTVLGRLMFNEHRDIYKRRRRFGKDDKEHEYKSTNRGLPGVEFYDNARTWEENKALVQKQLNKMARKHKEEKAKQIQCPSDVSKRVAAWWQTFINGGYMSRGLLRHRNGMPVTRAYMAAKMGCSIETVKRIISELTRKGYMTKEYRRAGEFYRMHGYSFGESKKSKESKEQREISLEESKRRYGEWCEKLTANLTPLQKKIMDRLL